MHKEHFGCRPTKLQILLLISFTVQDIAQDVAARRLIVAKKKYVHKLYTYNNSSRVQ